MADFKVQRGNATIATSATTATITAGVGYTAPSAITAAFIRIVASRSFGCESVESTQGADAVAAYISNPANLLTSITFTRSDANATVGVRIEWEIIEYIGSGGGANEFIVRGQEALTYTSTSDTKAGATIGTVATDADLCCFLTGQGGPAGGGYTDQLTILSWDTGADTVVGTRVRDNNSASVFSYAAVEFTGSNWTVQRIAHTFTAAGATETETMTDVGSLARAFGHVQYIPGAGGDNFQMSARAWLSSTTQVSFFLDSQASVANPEQCVVWVVSNSQTNGTPAVCQRLTGTFNTSSASTGVTISAVADMGQTSIMEESQTNAQNSPSPGRDQMALSLTTTTNVNIYHIGASLATTTYRFAVFEWPTVAAGGGVTVSPSIQPTFGSVGNLSVKPFRD